MKLTRGARQLLDFLKNRSGRNGQCWWKQANIADQLGCHRSSVVRWVRELTDAGALESIRRGSTSNLYTLSKSCGKQVDFDFTNATTDVAICDIVEPPVIISELKSLKDTWTEALAPHLESVQIAPTADLVAKIKQKAFFYGADAYRVGAAIERARRKVAKSPSLKPRGPGWVLAVVENDLKPPTAPAAPVKKPAVSAESGRPAIWTGLDESFRHSPPGNPAMRAHFDSAIDRLARERRLA